LPRRRTAEVAPERASTRGSGIQQHYPADW